MHRYPPVGNQDLFERTFPHPLLGIAVDKVGHVIMLLSNSRILAPVKCPVRPYHIMRFGETVVFDISRHCKSTPINKNTSYGSHSVKCLKNTEESKTKFQ